MCFFLQLQLPAVDGRGEALAPAESVATLIAHQQTIIYLLMGVIVVSLLVVAWIATLYLRSQFTLERMAEAIRRVDLLAEAFRRADVQWQHHDDESQEAGALVDLDEDALKR